MLSFAIIILLVLGVLFVDPISRTVNRIKLPTAGKQQFILFAGILLTVLLVLFSEVIFNPRLTLFSNDGPLGNRVAESSSIKGSIGGQWLDLNWIGKADVPVSPNFTALLALMCDCPIVLLFVVGVGIFLYKKV